MLSPDYSSARFICVGVLQSAEVANGDEYALLRVHYDHKSRWVRVRKIRLFPSPSTASVIGCCIILSESPISEMSLTRRGPVPLSDIQINRYYTSSDQKLLYELRMSNLTFDLLIVTLTDFQSDTVP